MLVGIGAVCGNRLGREIPGNSEDYGMKVLGNFVKYGGILIII